MTTELEKMAEDWWVKNRDLNLSGEGVFGDTNGFIAGFKVAQEIALGAWLHKEHVYCDFYYDGAKILVENKQHPYSEDTRNRIMNNNP